MPSPFLILACAFLAALLIIVAIIVTMRVARLIRLGVDLLRSSEPRAAA
jgi:hypothetical protein